MAIILNIDTSTEFASVALSKDREIVGFTSHEHQKNHGAFLQPAIQQICKDAGIEIQQIQAVAVANGPGSYTGLRIGLSSAKGLCYALNIPLITVSTLQVIAKAAIDNCNENALANNVLFCPMIDARRMEVFKGIYDKNLHIVEEEKPFIISETSFLEQLNSNKIIFCGNGSEKIKTIITHQNAVYSSIQHNAKHLAILADNHYKKEAFSDLSYTEPTYLKAFFTG